MKPEPTMTVGDEFPVQQARCRELMLAYHDIGPAGKFCLVHIEDVLHRADLAAISGDILAILRSVKEMRECE